MAMEENKPGCEPAISTAPQSSKGPMSMLAWRKKNGGAWRMLCSSRHPRQKAAQSEGMDPWSIKQAPKCRRCFSSASLEQAAYRGRSLLLDNLQSLVSPLHWF